MTRLKIASAMLAGTTALAVGSAALADHGPADWADIGIEVFATGSLHDDVHFNSDRIKFQTKDPTTIRNLRLTFAPYAHTTWHYHPGVTFVTVQSGTLSVEQQDCTAHEFGAGESFVEADDDPHQATAGANGATLLVTYVVPTTNPLGPASFRRDTAPPACAS